MGKWTFIERACIVVGLIFAGATLYFTAGTYYGWNAPPAPLISPPSSGAASMNLQLYVFGGLGFALLITAWGMIFVRTRPRPQYRTTDLEKIENKTYRNEIVLISGRHFVGCKFENVTFLYNGGGVGLDRCVFGGFQLKSDIPEVTGMVSILNALGLLKIPVVDEGGLKLPTNPIPDEVLRAKDQR